MIVNLTRILSQSIDTIIPIISLTIDVLLAKTTNCIKVICIRICSFTYSSLRNRVVIFSIWNFNSQLFYLLAETNQKCSI